MSKGVVKTEKTTGAVVDSAFYGKVRDVFEQARQFVCTTAQTYLLCMCQNMYSVLFKYPVLQRSSVFGLKNLIHTGLVKCNRIG